MFYASADVPFYAFMYFALCVQRQRTLWFGALWINKLVSLYIFIVLASRKICNRWLDNKLSTKRKWQKGVTQGAVSCHFSILTKICFICLRHAYSLSRTRFLLISANIIYTNGAYFRYDTKWQYTALWATLFCYFVYHSSCYQATIPNLAWCQ